MGMRMQKRFLLIAAILIAVGLGMWIADLKMMNASSLPVLSDIGTDFELTATDDARISLKDYRGRIVIVFFGYTSCPDVCPTGLYTLKKVMYELGKDSKQLQVLFISVDPERDSAERLQEYVSFFHRDFIGLTGTLEETTRVANAYLAQFIKEPVLPDGGYQVSHSAFFYLLDKQGRARVLHDPSSTAEQIVMDVHSLLDEYDEFIF